MEIRDYGAALLEATTLEGKLAPPPHDLTDDVPGEPVRVDAPGRPPQLAIVPGGRAKVPSVRGLVDPAQRRRILHAFANHELQATEAFAWALLAFPDAPPAFRRGCVAILADEQRHCALYIARLLAHGGHFGEQPVSGHFWRKLPRVRTAIEFVCTFGLTFENANLDFALEHARAARAAGDEATAAVLEQVHRDEVRHVAFAWQWLARWKEPGQSMWDAYRAAVAPPHGPSRARGAPFDPPSRVAAGFEPDFIERLAATRPDAPGGAPR